MLLDIYKNELAKDGEFEKYLTKIGEIYFNVKPRPTGGFLGNLLQSFLQESDEEEESTQTKSQSQQPQSNQPAPPSMPAFPVFPPFSLFEQMCQPRPSASRPAQSDSTKNNNQSNMDDLD